MALGINRGTISKYFCNNQQNHIEVDIFSSENAARRGS
jgi:hypothetical protein